MTDVRHTTTLVVNADTRRALPDVQRLQTALDRVEATAGRIGFGGGGRGGRPGGGGGYGGGGGVGAGGGPGHWWQGMQSKIGPTAAAAKRRRALAIGAGVAGAAGAMATGGPAAEWRAMTGAGISGMRGAADRMRYDAAGKERGGHIGRLGTGIAAAIPFAGAAAAVGAAGLQRYYANAVAAARARTAMNATSLYGRTYKLGAGSGYGYGPTETASLLGQFGGAAGVSNALVGQDPLALARAGVSLGAAGGYRGLTAAGAGGSGNASPTSMVRLAQMSGLRGGKVDEYLQRISQATGQMADRGMTLDLSATETFMRRLQGTGGTAATGLYQPRVVGAMSGARGAAKQRLFGGFESIGEAAMLAKAMQGGGNIFDIGRRLEQMSDPADQLAALKSFGGEFGTAGFFAGQLPVDMAQALGSGKLGKPVGTGRLQRAYASAGSVALAKSEASKMAAAGGGSDVTAIQRVETLDKLLIETGKVTNNFLEMIYDIMVKAGIGGQGVVTDDIKKLIKRVGQLVGP